MSQASGEVASPAAAVGPSEISQGGSGNVSRGGPEGRGGSRGSRGGRMNGQDSFAQEGGRGARGGGRRGARGGNGGGGSGQRIDRPNGGRGAQQGEAQKRRPPPTSSEDPKPSDIRPIADSAKAAVEGGADDVEAEVCFICASPVQHQSVAPCNHRTCHICSLRLRALYKTRACAHCRSEAKYVIFTDDPEKRFENFVDADFQQVDEVLGIRYEKKEIHDDTILLLRYNCPEESCEVACLGWPDLHRHVRSKHHKVMCDLCTRNKKVFTHEHELYTQQELRKHEKFGDDNPGAVDQSGFKGHPECGFCRQRFYGDDELYAHCRDKHEKCHICERRHSGRQQQQYYIDYNSLEEHFRKDHFLCLDRECLEKKFVVFESEMDLKAHQLQTHPNDMSKDVRRDARRVDLSSFDYRTPHQEPIRGGRSGRGRGRDPHAEPIPASSAQPLRRDELAYQRQMAIQSAQSVAPRTFGGQLTTRPQEGPTMPEALGRGRGGGGSHAAMEQQLGDIGGGINSTTPRPTSSGGPTPAQVLSPQDEARRLRHAAVMERAQSMLGNDAAKSSTFRARVSAYRTGAISAADLVDSFLMLFDASSADLGKLVKELAEIYENETRRVDLLKAWNDWRAINEDYPSLPLSADATTSAGGAGGGRRILKLKSSTAQSSRSAVSRQAGWGTASSANPFPPMPASANRAGPGRVGPVPWTSSSSTSFSRPITTSTSSSPITSSTIRSSAVAAPSRPANKPPTSSADAFPALPAAPKPNTLIAGLHRGAARWDDRSSNKAVVNPWTQQASGQGQGGSSTSVGASASEAEATVEGGSGSVGGKGKKGKPKKQTLYKFG